MRLTAVHVQYWHARTSPAWARGKVGMPIVSINECVNEHAFGPVPLHADITRLCDVLQGASKEAIRGELDRIASMPYGTRYYATARRWLKRLKEADALAWWQGRAGLTGAALAAYDRTAPPFEWSQRPVRIAWSVESETMIARWREDHPEIVQAWAAMASRNVKSHDVKPRPYQLAALDSLLSTVDLRPSEPINRQMAFYSYAWASRQR